MQNKKWFTLLELLLAVLIAWTLIWIIMSIYTWILWVDLRMNDKMLLTAEASNLMDTIHTAALDYTIDYEEYFNRNRLWFWVSDTHFTSYGNSWEWYYCWNWFTNISDVNRKYDIFLWSELSWWCEQTSIEKQPQKYLEYKFQHWKLNTWELNNRENTDSNMYMWPVAINPNTWVDYLYLINPEGTERYYFRRILTGANHDLYKIQTLRLYWYDAGDLHDFSAWSWWRYDWFLDTWACDFEQWFICHWNSVTWEFKLPNSYYDWRVDITSDKVSVTDFRIDIYPNKNPYYDTSTNNIQDPFAKITVTMSMYGKPSNEEITLSSSYSFKNSYFNFPVEVKDNVPNDD